MTISMSEANRPTAGSVSVEDTMWLEVSMAGSVSVEDTMWLEVSTVFACSNRTKLMGQIMASSSKITKITYSYLPRMSVKQTLASSRSATVLGQSTGQAMSSSSFSMLLRPSSVSDIGLDLQVNVLSSSAPCQERGMSRRRPWAT